MPCSGSWCACRFSLISYCVCKSQNSLPQLRQCCLPAPDLPTILLHPGILHLSFPVSRCQWSRVTKSSCLSVSDTKKVGLVLLRLRFWKLFINEGSIHCLRFDDEDELPGGDNPDFIGVAKDVWTFFCALRNHDNKAPFESSSLCSISRCLFRFCIVLQFTWQMGHSIPSVGT